jgi:hypothetical protein
MRPDLPLHAVLDYLIRNWAGPCTEYSTYEMLTAIRQLGLRELLAALLFLDAAPSHMLKHKWTLKGASGQLYLTDQELQLVLWYNEYRDPVAGELVVGAALKVELRYEPGPTLNGLRGGVSAPGFEVCADRSY